MISTWNIWYGVLVDIANLSAYWTITPGWKDSGTVLLDPAL